MASQHYPKQRPIGPCAVDASTISAGDTAWMLTSTVLTTMLHSFVAVCIVSVLWAVTGYSIAFSPGNGFIGGLR